MADFKAYSLECNSYILCIVDIHDFESNLVGNTNYNNFLNYSYYNLILLIFFIPADIRALYMMIVDQDEISDICFTKQSLYKYYLYWPVNKSYRFFLFGLVILIKAIFVYHLPFDLLK